ncbi:gamma-glutamyltransferase family protein [Paralimibaculum aggregatum]|uniref:Gamma-glutamyltransferase family protein n=1 Tax=Paralimibaculum aggregatum TaxID=3036245 RepID=A0ABQ6LR55_9RHOB|nr:gamma-glutamyltransferase family protein [Limibaculum sp. NKW23]GMG84772.1 gamma-glutamyltransferase family protein [Limibaculum sp. NKW23]
MSQFQSPGRSAVYAQNGMAATSHPLGARVAVEMLEAGGNAVDAALAGAVLLGICEPQMTGLGGDLFAIVKPAGSEDLVGLNASGRAPAGLDAAALRARGLSAMPDATGDSVVVPGAVAGIAHLAERHGRKGLDAVLAPAIRYAEQGVPVAPRVALDWAEAAERLQGAGRRHFLAGERALPVGAVFRAPGQAEVLRRIAAEGPRGFYEGEVAEDMIAALRAAGGSHTAADFAACRADEVTPVSAPYRGAEVVELPPNSHGATALLMLRMLERFGVETHPFGAERAHLEMEIAKLGYAARNQMISDPATMTMSVEEFIAEATAADLAGRISRERAGPMPVDPLGSPHRDTIYITVVDRDGMAVSLIYSIFANFGSGIASERFGILFNNRAAGFALAEGHPNEAGGGKRPLHTIIPGMIREGGRVTVPFGVMGGPYQAAGHVRFVSNLVDYGMDLQAAIDAPRVFFEGDALKLEAGYGADVAAALEAKGHGIIRPQAGIGGAQAIRIDHARGVLIGASDPRKDGIALGC